MVGHWSNDLEFCKMTTVPARDIRILGVVQNYQYFFCMLLAYKRVGGCVAKTPIADNFEMIDFFRIFLHNPKVFYL